MYSSGLNDALKSIKQHQNQQAQQSDIMCDAAWDQNTLFYNKLT